ncbi:MAG: DUF4912 domain-containing protein [Clostridia bacterium]
MPRKPANKLENTEGKSTEKKEATKKTATKKTSATKSNKKTASENSIVANAKNTTAEKTSAVKATKSSKEPAKKTASKKVREKEEASSKKSTASKASTAKAKSSTAKKAGAKTSSKKAGATKAKSSTTKKASTKTTAKKTSSTAKKATTRKTSTKKSIAPEEITSSTDLTKKIEILEYYDLPYRYNQTVVKVLAQTPTTLFIYWDISDVDRANFVEQYGEDFFNYTKPVLIIRNLTAHYSFEIEIDDFANSWYLHVNDSNCEYSVELGRRPKYYNEQRHIDIPNNYLYVTSSNIIDSPNDHILFDKNLKTVYFKDVKTNIVTAKDITSISFLRNMGRIYSLYDLQGDFINNNWINGLQLDLRNPSSSNPSSTFK